MLFDFPDDSKYCHFAMAADSGQLAQLAGLTSLDEASHFCEAESRTYGLRWAEQPLQTPRDDLSLPFELSDPDRKTLRTPSHPALVEALHNRVIERHPRLVELNAPEIIIDNEAASIRHLLDDMAAYNDAPVATVSSWAVCDAPDLEHLLSLCRVSHNLGLIDWFACSNPVARAIVGQNIYTASELHPPRRLQIPFIESHGDVVFIGEGDELTTLAHHLETNPPQLGPTREEVERSDDPNVLRLVDALPASAIADTLVDYDRQRKHYAATCRRLADEGLALVSWIDVNPAV